MFKKSLKWLSYGLIAVAVSSASAGSYEDFFTAVKRDDAGTLRALASRGFDVNSRGPEGQTGLFLAAKAEAWRAFEALLAAPGIDLDATNEAGETAMMIAAIKGRADLVKRLLDLGAQVNKPGWTALHYAASGPDTESVRLLIERGAAIEATSPNRSTPLMLAAGYGPEASVDLLLARGADPKRRNDLQLSAADFARRAERVQLAARLESNAPR